MCQPELTVRNFFFFSADPKKSACSLPLKKAPKIQPISELRSAIRGIRQNDSLAAAAGKPTGSENFEAERREPCDTC
jgi:hypothetical protein